MESWQSPYGESGGYPLRVAANWTRFVQSYYDSEPRFMTDDDYASRFGPCCGAIEREIEGNYSQNMWSGHDFVAGIYQRIHGVLPGKGYTAKAWMFSAMGSYSDPDRPLTKEVGIDPYGGTNASAPGVVWGEPNTRDHTYDDIDVRASAVAQNDVITLFLRVTNPEVYPYWNAVWMDAVVLAEAPTVSASSPEFSDSVSFTVSWDNAQAAPGGHLMGLYDVQVKDGIDGEWVTWKRKKSSTSDVYTGVVGHTYYFRARAWQEYDPEGIELYGAYNPDPEGDTHTTVGRILHGHVDNNRGYPVYGAAVTVPQTGATTTTDLQGQYNLSLPEPGTYSLTVGAVGFGPPPPVPFTVQSGTVDLAVPLTLRPPVEGIANGDFENGVNGWATSGSPQVQSVTLRSGAQSLRLPVGASVEQTFTVSDMYKPLLSFYAQTDGGTLTVTSGGETLLTVTDSAGWTHYWAPFEIASQVYTGQLDVRFACQGGGDVYLDEVSVGKSPGGPIETSAPYVVKDH